MLAIGLPMAFLSKDSNGPPPSGAAFCKDFRFVTPFLSGLVATLPLFVPVFFIPPYTESFSIPSLGGAGLVTAFKSPLSSGASAAARSPTH
ncbi:hypothetical protein F4802DRAFT_595836 [Xylaria palmicola]|nr:hypothetical protein F4802DRAFT_595836 [Xylaria palmicola]